MAIDASEGRGRYKLSREVGCPLVASASAEMLIPSICKRNHDEDVDEGCLPSFLPSFLQALFERRGGPAHEEDEEDSLIARAAQCDSQLNFNGRRGVIIMEAGIFDAGFGEILRSPLLLQWAEKHKFHPDSRKPVITDPSLNYHPHPPCR